MISAQPSRLIGATFWSKCPFTVNCTASFRRWLPGMALRSAKCPFSNVNRQRGYSHYGISRTFRVFFDLITIRFLLRYLSRPLHFFGTLGMLSILAGSGVSAWLLVEKFLHRLTSW